MRELAPIGQLSWPTAGEDVCSPRTVSDAVAGLQFSFSYSDSDIQIHIPIFIFAYSHWDADSCASCDVCCAKRRQKSIKYLCSQLVQACGSCICRRCHRHCRRAVAVAASRRQVASNVIGSDSCIMILLNCA